MSAFQKPCQAATWLERKPIALRATGASHGVHQFVKSRTLSAFHLAQKNSPISTAPLFDLCPAAMIFASSTENQYENAF